MRTLFILASVALVGCAASSEPEGGSDLPLAPYSAAGRAMPGASDEARSATTDTSLAGPRPADSSSSCVQGAFCDSFESSGYAADWKGAFTTGRALIELGRDSATVGVGSLRLTTHDDESTAYLRHESGEVGAQWSGSLSFAFRLAQVPASYLGGPQLTVKTAFGPVYVRLFATPEGVFIEQNGTASCPVERCIGTRTSIAKAVPNHWYNIDLRFHANGHNSAPYGSIEALVNHGEAVVADLNVPLSDGSVFLEAGITQGDPGRDSVLDLDDVALLVR